MKSKKAKLIEKLHCTAQVINDREEKILKLILLRYELVQRLGYETLEELLNPDLYLSIERQLEKIDSAITRLREQQKLSETSETDEKGYFQLLREIRRKHQTAPALA